MQKTILGGRTLHIYTLSHSHSHFIHIQSAEMNEQVLVQCMVASDKHASMQAANIKHV